MVISNDIYGKLYIVSTPIGNLQDMTYRAVETLKNVDIIAAEDTRHTKELLNHFEIKTSIISCHEHNEYEKSKDLINEIKNGKNIAIVTDAGTPIVSDPGSELVKEAINEGIIVTAVPGACAAINALVMSGLSAKSFTFIGFIPEDKKKREKIFKRLKDETNTMIFYISPHNLLSDISILIGKFGEDRLASISREMTKIHEENVRGTLLDIKKYFEAKTIKGEFVLVVSGRDEEELECERKDKWLSMSIESHMNYYINKGFNEKDAMKKVALDRGIDKRDIYKRLKVKE